MADADACPECGAPRPRRAAGCARCGHIFQDIPAAEAGLPAARAPAPSPSPAAPHPDDARAERGSGCGPCLLLLAICAILTVIASVVLYFVARAELAPLFERLESGMGAAGLTRLSGALEEHAGGHGGRLPDTLDALDVPSEWLVDPWGEPYGYAPADDGRSARLTSLGADSAPGGEGSAADLERDVVLP